MLNMKDLNLNSYVGVKLTDEGLRILEYQHNELLKGMKPEVAATVGAFKAPQVDEEGYSQILLWQLMQSFGNYVYAGNPKPPFEMNIKILDKYLIEHTVNKSKNR